MSTDTDKLLSEDDLKSVATTDAGGHRGTQAPFPPVQPALHRNGGAKPDAGERLRVLAKMRDERRALYGDNYIKAGYAMAFMLGKIELRTPRDYIRFGLLVQEYSKLSRYSVQWKDGHQDSLDDLAVYAQLLAEVDAMTDEDLAKAATKTMIVRER